jgi:hypothetical protein
VARRLLPRESTTRTFGELQIDLEEDKAAARAVIFRLLREIEEK